MSSAFIPYHLRPHKSVDRRLFLDLLSRFERWVPLADYVYVSMGAYPLEDHKLVHRHLGIKRLVAFDMEEGVVARQKFNRPIEECNCLHMTSDALISNFDSVLSECSFSNPSGVIVWLDYTNPRQIGQQIREFQTLLDKLRAGDLVRVTVNSQPNTYTDALSISDAPVLAEEKRKKQFHNLKSRIGEFLPADASPDTMTMDGLPLVIRYSVHYRSQGMLTGSKCFQ
jgi:hypothetical protein